VNVKPDFQVGIVGAGFAGVVAALRLRQAKQNSFVIFERAASSGGTWRDNTYPGCACDVPSNVYSISFAPNPNWSRGYSPQAEILAYLRGVIATHQLEPHIRYNSDIVRSEFNQAVGLWTLTTRAGESVTVRQVIVATGPFNRPKMPDIMGIERFKSIRLHSARWDESRDLTGKRVAVVGTGASAVQLVPEIAPVVSSLVVFQRSAAWIGNRMDSNVADSTKANYRKYPWLQRAMRNAIYGVMELRGLLFIGNKFVHNLVRQQSLQKLEREVRDPELRAKLTPHYELGCKRILTSDTYLPVFNRENVKLETAGILEITESGIRTVDGRHFDVDAIIFATGFEVAEITTDAQIVGLNGRELYGEWREAGMEAFKGASISGFPNLNFLLGPNTGLGHSSMIGIMEAQMNYIMDYNALLERGGDAGYLDLKQEVQRDYNARLQRLFGTTVWASGCSSWYLNSGGKITTLYPRLVEDFRAKTRRVNPSDYNIVRV
jgi:cation diffusion facilitator CzcD-associated flavoprotein CzcO